MKLIVLNIWGGRGGRENLINFFAKNKKLVDVFCLQEMWSGPYTEYSDRLIGGVRMDYSQLMVDSVQRISELMSGYTAYFRPQLLKDYGLMMLVDENLQVVEEGEEFVYKQKGFVPEGDLGMHARNIQYATINTSEGLRTVINFHGLWNGMGKGDSDDRLAQSQNIINFLKKLDHPYVLCGDFNLLPDTKSLKMFEEFGLRNLIDEYGIKSTRSILYEKPNKFADYVFVDPRIKVKQFYVMEDVVSDHSPLYLEFE